MYAHSHQTGDEFSRACGFASFEELRVASHHLPTHEGPRQFVANAPDGTVVIWSEDDFDEMQDDELAP